MMIGWNFPSNGGGLIRGIAEAGIQTFTGKEISSLAREVCQNSLDAALNESSAVTVEFQLREIYTRNVPGYSDYKNILIKCRDYWRDNLKAKNFLDRAIKQIHLLKTSVLQISDYNTTGLAEPYNLRAQNGWNALTKIDGGATKTGDSAGSFGIGKNAPFANSFFRLVFYRTFNTEDKRAAQGMSRLVSFQRNSDDISAGIGYYGEFEKNLPVNKIDELENISRREDKGTDIFIYGFNGDKTWAEQIISEVLKNFLVAIHRDKLRVKVQGETFHKNNLGECLRKKEGDCDYQKASNYYKALTGDGVKIFERDFHGMGNLKLRVLLDPKTNLNRKILVVRKSGMKLFEQDRISRTLSFTGILELEGRELNEFFREMETPQHDKWEPGRYEKNPTLAKKYLEELRDWVRKTIQGLGEENISDEVNVEGLSHMLDFDDSAIIGGSQIEEETLDNPSKPDDFLQDLSKENVAGKNNPKTQRAIGNIKSDGTSSAIRTLTGTRKRKTLAEHRGEKNPEGKDIIQASNERKVNCDKIRVIKVGEKNYRLILRVPRNISSGSLEIFAVGENNSGEKIFVASATSADSNSYVQLAGDKIILKNLQANADTKIIFELQDNGNYALGVAIYED